MEFKKEKLVRLVSLVVFSLFYDSHLLSLMIWLKGVLKIYRFNASQNLEKTLPVHKTSKPLVKTEGGGINSDRNTSNKVPRFGRFKVFPENHHEPYWRERILDPGSDVILKWNRIFLFSCLTALLVDPLFFSSFHQQATRKSHLVWILI
jgi:hypothetical protein